MLLRLKIFHHEQQEQFCSRMFTVILFHCSERKTQHRAFDLWDLCVLSLLWLSLATSFYMFFLNVLICYNDEIRTGKAVTRFEPWFFCFFLDKKPDSSSKSSWDQIADASVFWLFSFQRTDLHPISHHLIMCLPALARVSKRKKEKNERQIGPGAKGLFWWSSNRSNWICSDNENSV